VRLVGGERDVRQWEEGGDIEGCEASEGVWSDVRLVGGGRGYGGM